MHAAGDQRLQQQVLDEADVRSRRRSWPEPFRRRASSASFTA